MEIRCEECDIIFKKKTKNQRYCCPKCKRAGGRRKARETGMTYGKYIAQEYGKQVKFERR